ncbi:MAG: adenosylmethionine--8-amino-7-oxononanoate transaminase [Nitrospirota bacterium]
MKMVTLEDKDRHYIWHPFTQMKDWLEECPLIIKEGRGSFLKDIYGRWYLDGVSSLWATIHGHRKKEIDDAIKEQLEKIGHSTLLGLSNPPAINLAEKLVELSPKSGSELRTPMGRRPNSELSKVFYSDNGSTAVEISLKIAFQYCQHKGEKGKTRFLSLNNAYHGDTLGAVGVGGIEVFHNIYRSIIIPSLKAPSPYCYRCELNLTYPSCNIECAKELERTTSRHKDEIAALIIEPLVQAAAGMLISPPGYLKEVRRICTENNILMIADEVATGFGRTGKMFACEHEGVCPDIMAIAKGITGGYLPLAATLTTQDIFNSFLGEYKELKTFFHGHTYTGNPLACASALANLEIFEKDRTLDMLQEKIVFLEDRLRPIAELDHVGEVRQKGFMVGIELVKDKNTKEPYPLDDKIGVKVILKAKEKGLIIRPLGNVIVLMPPLSISPEELKRMVGIVHWAIKEVTE